MTQPNTTSRAPLRRWLLRHAMAASISGILLAAGIVWAVHAATLERTRVRLLRIAPDAAAQDPALVKAALAEAQPLYVRHCAVCHGERMQGNPAIGAPNLADGVWLYGSGTVFEIERTVLYGIRSGMSKAHNVSDMPAFGLSGILRTDEIRELVQYLLQLSGRPHEGQAALAGRELFVGRGTCFDCHGADGAGNPDYGAPDLTRNVWNSGGDVASLYHSIYFGQHRIMPGSIDKLTLTQIRALAVYVHATDRSSSGGHSAAEAYAATVAP